ncbi:MAG: flagellar motor switch protein FliN, partial [Clostridiales bacterium]|nr:flagellar motor switch protein FliN [Clostridiales bacterium]
EKRLTAEEIDTIGEIMNISMGAAATAVSTMLERQVVITTPNIEQNKIENIDCSDLEPAIVVKINYVEGITGTNVVIFHRNDMRIILDLLMGNDFNSAPDDNFEFDDMSMSAACEVMNQMMGASATALSELLGKYINISTPHAELVEADDEIRKMLQEFGTEEEVTTISFKMMIKETLDTNFTSIMPMDLAKEIVSAMHNDIEETPPQIQQPEPRQTVQQQATQAAQPQVPQQTAQAVQPQVPPQASQAAQPQMPQQQAAQAAQPQMPQQQAAQAAQPQMPQQTSQPQMSPYFPQAGPAPYQPTYPPQMPEQYQYGYPNPQQPGAAPYQPPYPPHMPYSPQYMQVPYGNEYYSYQSAPAQEQHPNLRYAAPMVNVRQADFPEFPGNAKPNSQPYPANINMLMGVQLEVSVVVGRAKQKIKDVLEFGQGSVIELDKQTGAPAEVMVNGQLLAYGDVVVVGDNFGVRITEIVGTKELLDSLDVKK